MLAAIKTAHASISFGPDAEIFQFGVDRIAGRHHLGDVPPIHAYVVDGAVRCVGDQAIEHRFQEIRKPFRSHFAARHGELTMADVAKTANIAIDRKVIRWVGENDLGLFAGE